MSICQCGCGQVIVWAAHHKYQPPRFLPGHHQRTAAFLESRARLTLQPPGEVPTGICECGCGGKTPIAKQSRPAFGQYKGHPLRFLHGHNPRGRRAHGWKGGRRLNGAGYWLVWMPGHHLALKSGYVPEHRLAWENANGRRLRAREHVHHIDGDTTNNDPSNLVALSASQHTALHAALPRSREKKAASIRKYYQSPGALEKASETTRKGWETRRGH